MVLQFFITIIWEMETIGDKHFLLLPERRKTRLNLSVK